MYLEDFEGTVRVESAEDLSQRLAVARKGDYGSFVLWHDDGGPSLFVQINKAVAYLHYFRDESHSHPGYQPTGMSPTNCDECVRFLDTCGVEGDGVEMPRATLVPVELAYNAALEFFANADKPPSIRWFEL